MENFLELFLWTAACTVILNVIFKRYDIPTIIGYIFTGIVISKFFGVEYSEEWAKIAEFGIVFLMFSIGLEFSFKHLWAMKADVFINGLVQVFITGVIFSIIAQYAFDIGQQTSIIIGFALALSSTAIVLKVLNDNGDISQIYGRKALGILLFQDIAVIPILLMIDIFNSKSSSLSELVSTTLISATILIISLYFIGKYIFNWVLYFVVKTNSQEIFIATILFIVVGASFLASYLGFSHTLGAFLAGMLLAETQYKPQIEGDLIPFRDLLLGLFFITVGIQVNFEIIVKNIFMVFVVLIDVMILKVVVIYALLSLKQKRRVAIKTALSICQIGEFALAIFAILFSNRMLEAQTSQILTAVVILSMIITPFILKNIGRIADKLENNDDPNAELMKIKLEDMRDHFIVCGYGRLGQEVVQRIKSQGLKYLVIESDVGLVKLGRSRDESVYYGNATQALTLNNAGIAHCSAVIATVSNEQKLDMIANTIKDMNLGTNTVIRYAGGEHQLYANLGDNFHLIKEERAVARVLINEALQCKISSGVGE